MSVGSRSYENTKRLQKRFLSKSTRKNKDAVLFERNANINDDSDYDDEHDEFKSESPREEADEVVSINQFKPA